ncbi:hypothetical protein [Abyssalbus ytuae]|uniref:Uncharacterized protein n=1 Tax=Abyssalbus ytuae TaxID=2926907 RepID=A0A9E6ZRW9_9FLAO|nr:hypothetical protein [Abyssalbus ytuae]UOB17718.1 hypothetical protein MQE35_00120 [Abyssalbus ytuae]
MKKLEILKGFKKLQKKEQKEILGGSLNCPPGYEPDECDMYCVIKGAPYFTPC